LVQLQADHERIEAAGILLVAISYDPLDALADFARDGNITFPLLADPGNRTIDAYGIRDPQGNGYPHPQTFLVRRDGTIGAVLSPSGYMTRHTTDELIEAGGRIK
jgi:peroxiredoxin